MIPVRQGIQVLQREGPVNFIKKSVRYLKIGSSQGWTRHFGIEQGDTVVDVGANVGHFTKIAAEKVGDSGTVFAIEPGPDNLRELRDNVGEYENVEIVEAAIMDHNGEIELHINPEDPAGHSVFESVVGAGHRARGEEVYAADSVEVEAITINKFCSENNIHSIDFLKIDIESGEIAALDGAEKMLDKTKKVVVEAYHPKPGEVSNEPGEEINERTYPEVNKILSQRGFETQITDDKWVFAER